jgi:phage shock protein PspC (stress-responsive transcriptional regulator)
MKKTIKINISGVIFHIDEDAYEVLSKYLDRIHAHFKDQEGGGEIISDIEMRMAELFQARLSEHKQVISIEDVETVAGKMGDPQDFSQGEDTASSGSSVAGTKKLYRDPDHAILGGVASGMGAYLNVDPVWIRLLFVVLMLGYGFIAVLYLLLWLFIPKATTYEQKLEMEGEKVTISNIEKKVKEEYEEVKSNFRKYRRSEQYKNIGQGLNEIFIILGKILRVAFQVILILIGAGLVIGGISVALGLLGASLFHWPFHIFDMLEYGNGTLFFIAESVFDSTTLILISLALILIAGLPLFVIIYAGIRLLTGFTRTDRKVFLISLMVWLGAILLAVGSLLWQIHHFSYRSHTMEETTLNPAGDDVLVLKMDKADGLAYYTDDLPFSGDHSEIQGTDRAGNLYIEPEIAILPSQDEAYHIEIKKSSRGPSHHKAAQLADRITYPWSLKDSTLTLASGFRVDKKTPYRIQQLNISIHIPKGKYIIIPEEAEEYLDQAENEHDLWHYEMGGKKWRMSGDELTLHK